MNTPSHFPLFLACGLHRASLAFAVCLVVFWCGLRAQPADVSAVHPVLPPGAVTGRVQNIVTGQYLSNARVGVKGTTLVVFTDESGNYRLTDVPGGPVVLEVFYTGLDPQSVPLDLPAGQNVERDIKLTSIERYGRNEGVVKLDPFVVANSKMTEGAALAINEQRFAPNLKNIVATDTFGDVSEGNVAEFMKFMPGISVEYEGDAPTTIQVRGLNASMTAVSVDGAQTANAVRVGASREFHFKQVSINDTSRIEVTKVPTPATPASSMGGSINLVSKSAFERDRGQFNYSVYLAGNNRAFSFTKTPHTREDYTYKIVPNLNFDYTLPINKNLGIIVTGLSSIQYAANSYDTTNYSTAAAVPGASFAKPFLTGYSVVDFASYHNRYSLSLKVDWRPTPSSVLSVSGRTTYYQDFNGNDTLAFAAGTNGTPTPATGVAMTFSDKFVIGATGRGGVTMNNNHSNIQGASTAGNVRYRLEAGNWHVDSGFNYSQSRTWRRYTSFGNFRGLNVALMTPVRVSYNDIDAKRPGSIQVFDNNNREVDYHDIRNYRLTGATATSSGDVRERIVSGDINIRRKLSFLAFPATIQVGGQQQVQARDIRVENYNWTYNSPDGNLTPSAYLSQVYAGYKSYPGVGTIPWTSPKLAFEAWQKNPSLFTKTPAQQVTEEQFRLTNSSYIKERTEAYYVQGDMRLFQNRLRLLTGVRFEKTTDDGMGPLVEPSAVFVRNADGSFAHNAAGARIRKPEAGVAGSIEDLRLTTHARESPSNRTYDGYYPSLHLTYNATEKLLVRAAYAKTYGRPDFDSIIPNTIITEFDDVTANSSVAGGTITIRNTALRPWSADNYDLSLEYYTDLGGVISGGVFLKDIKNFFGDIVKTATLADLQELGLDPQYVGWTITTQFNAGDARITGAEINVRQSLLALGNGGRHFEVFANATKLKLEGNQNADFGGFMPYTLNWGVSFRRAPVTFMANWNHRGEAPLAPFPAAGEGGYTYWKASTTLDLYSNYQLNKRLSLFASARNVFNVPRMFIRYSSVTPDYAKVNRTENYGVKFSFGVKGTF